MDAGLRKNELKFDYNQFDSGLLHKTNCKIISFNEFYLTDVLGLDLKSRVGSRFQRFLLGVFRRYTSP